MGCALALPLVTSLVAAVSAHGDLEVRTESRSTTLSLSGAPQLTRESAIVRPRLAGHLDDEDLRVTAEYQPRIWTSDVAVSPSPLVDHTVLAGVQMRGDRIWRAGATGTATRGKTDPLSDLLATATATTPAAGQLASTSPVAYESLRLGGDGALQLSPRTTAGATGTFAVSQGADAAARRLLPPQRIGGGGLSSSHLLTLRDTLRVAADATFSVTSAPGGDLHSAFGTASASWRRRLSSTLDGSIGGGGSVTSERAPGGRTVVSTLPYAQLGLIRAGDEDRVAIEVVARLGPTVDRFTGEVRSTVEGSAGLRWQAGRDLAFTSSVSTGARIDGETTLGTWDGRSVWTLRDRLALELGLAGRWQRDRRPGVPSYVEAGAIVAVTYGVSVGGR